MPGSAFLTLGAGTKKVRMFVSYDREHDADLLDRLVEQASRATSGFEISSRSTTRFPTDHWDEVLRCKIREADQVIVICGQHTDRSGRVGAELRITQEEERPYLLLWGRRELMCTKPTTARPADSMYSWTPEILEDQICILRRDAESDQRVAEPGSRREGGEDGGGEGKVERESTRPAIQGLRASISQTESPRVEETGAFSSQGDAVSLDLKGFSL